MNEKLFIKTYGPSVDDSGPIEVSNGLFFQIVQDNPLSEEWFALVGTKSLFEDYRNKGMDPGWDDFRGRLLARIDTNSVGHRSYKNVHAVVNRWKDFIDEHNERVEDNSITVRVHFESSVDVSLEPREKWATTISDLDADEIGSLLLRLENMGYDTSTIVEYEVVNV